jgi:hypothetical protein
MTQSQVLEIHQRVSCNMCKWSGEVGSLKPAEKALSSDPNIHELYCPECNQVLGMSHFWVGPRVNLDKAIVYPTVFDQ